MSRKQYDDMTPSEKAEYHSEKSMFWLKFSIGAAIVALVAQLINLVNQ